MATLIWAKLKIPIQILQNLIQTVFFQNMAAVSLAASLPPHSAIPQCKCIGGNLWKSGHIKLCTQPEQPVNLYFLRSVVQSAASKDRGGCKSCMSIISVGTAADKNSLFIDILWWVLQSVLLSSCESHCYQNCLTYFIHMDKLCHK